MKNTHKHQKANFFFNYKNVGSIPETALFYMLGSRQRKWPSLEVIHFLQISVEFLIHFESYKCCLDMSAKHCIYFPLLHTHSNYILMQPVHHWIPKLTQHVTVNDLASQICTAATTKCAALSNTHACPPSRQRGLGSL